MGVEPFGCIHHISDVSEFVLCIELCHLLIPKRIMTVYIYICNSYSYMYVFEKLSANRQTKF